MNQPRIKNGVCPTGDDMKTSLIEGERIPKSHKVIRVFGCMERFNNDLQLYVCKYRNEVFFEEEDLKVFKWLITNLHNLGAFCYWKGNKPEFCFPSNFLDYINERIDFFQSHFGDCRDFMTFQYEKYILLDGCRISARELESAYATWYEFCYGKQSVKGDLKLMSSILNRLSSYFYNLNRYLIFKDKVEEIHWIGGVSKFE